jgi:hypothetical protein
MNPVNIYMKLKQNIACEETVGPVEGSRVWLASGEAFRCTRISHKLEGMFILRYDSISRDSSIKTDCTARNYGWWLNWRWCWSREEAEIITILGDIWHKSLGRRAVLSTTE